MFLESEITLAKELNSSAERELRKYLTTVRSSKVGLDAIVREFYEYREMGYYRHCHFMALLISNIDKEAGNEFMKINSNNFILSKYHHAWHLKKNDKNYEGDTFLAKAADEGHIWSKRDLIKIKRQNGEIPTLNFYMSMSILFVNGLWISFSQPSSDLIKKDF